MDIKISTSYQYQKGGKKEINDKLTNDWFLYLIFNKTVLFSSSHISLLTYPEK